MFSRVAWLPACLVCLAGCTAESTRLAIQAQQRADAVQQFVVEKQHESLRILLYRDLVAKLGQESGPLSEAQHAALNTAWNERDLIEFWMVQHERARALRLAGVDAKLYGGQSVIDLMVKGLEARWDRAKHALASYAGRTLIAPGTNSAQEESDGE